LATNYWIDVKKGKMTLKRKILLTITALLAVGAVILVSKWKVAIDNGGQKAIEPFRIAGNLYYVGTTDVTAFLLTGPGGHVLIDGGYPGTAQIIENSIAKLGFKITDVKILLNSHAHFDHAGGLAALQDASGAKLWISEGDADAIASGGVSKRNMWPLNFLVRIGLIKFPVPHVDWQFKDGEKIALGPIELTAHVTPGHTPGCTSWSFPVRDNGRNLLAVSNCSLTLLPLSLIGHRYDARLQQEFEHSFSTLRGLPADIFLASHADFFNMRRKLRERSTAADPVAPFIDRAGYLSYIDRAEQNFRKELKEQQD
jgi:metallo-beta-lactamase class B